MTVGLTRAARFTLLVVAIVASSLVGIISSVVQAHSAGATTSATPPFSPSTASWLDELNYDRSLAGLPAVTENTQWDQGDLLHAVYNVEMGTSGHTEDPTSPWYTQAGASAGMASSVAEWSGSTKSEKSWIDLWMLSPFHGVPFIRPGLSTSGFGDYANATEANAAVDVLDGLNPAAVTEPIMWPGNGVTTPFTSDPLGPGSEYPDPYSSCGGYMGTFGAPVFLELPQTPAVTSYSLTTNGVAVPTCEIDQTNYVNANSGEQEDGRADLWSTDTVVLMPEAALTPGATYHVNVATGTSAGDVSWSFNVAATNQASVALSSSEPFASPGDSVSFSAKVVQASGTTTPTGSVTFYDGNSALGTSTLDSSGNATFSSSSLNTGTYSITALYSGDTNYASAASSALTQTVRTPIAASTTTVAASPNPAFSNASVQLTATVSVPSGDPTPSGSVRFSEGGMSVGSAQLGAGGVASLAVYQLPVGNDTISAAYIGDTNYSGSTGTVSEVANAPASTQISFTPFSAAVPTGDDVTLLAQVSGPSGPLSSGLVNFDDVGGSGGTVQSVGILGTVSLNSSGQAEIPLSLAPGCYTLSAEFMGTPGLAQSTSSAVTICVGTPMGFPSNGSEFWGNNNPGTSGPTLCFSADPVNCYNGNLVEQAQDLTVGGRTPGYSWSRTYNALAAASATAAGPMGWGWSDSFAASLSFPDASDVVVNQGNGSTVEFTLVGSSYIAPANVTATLVKNADGSYSYTLSNQTVDHFTSSGQLQSIVDRNDDVLSLIYTSGHLTAIADGAGRSISLSYNANGQISSITDPAGHVVNYAYDTAGDLVSVTDPIGSVTSYSYDGSHRLLTMTNGNGGTTTNVYDASNRIVSQTDPMNRTTTWSYSGLTTTITDSRGSVRSETFDASGNLLSLTKGVGTSSPATSTYTYDGAGNRVSATDPDGHTTSRTFDSHGNVLTVTDPLGNITYYRYDAENDLLSTTDPEGNVTSLTYTSNGDSASMTRTLVSTGQAVVARYSHGDASHPGDVTAITDPGGNTTDYSYDAYGDVVKTTDPVGNVTTATYSVLGKKLSSTSPDGNVNGANPASYTTTYGYDRDGRLLSTTDPLGNTTTNVYDSVGNLLATTRPDGQTTRYSYDADNELTKTTEPNGSTSSSSYDADGNVVGQTNADGAASSYGYNALNEKVSSTDALNKSTSYSYDPAGNLVTQTNPSGQVTTNSYNGDNQLTNITYSDGSAPIAYTYGGDGELNSMEDATGVSVYTYDSLGRLVSDHSSSTGESVLYSYDPANNLTGLTYGDGEVVTNSYNGAGGMTAVNDGSGNVTKFGYDASGNLTAITHPDGSVDSYSYNANSEITDVSASTASSTIYNLVTPRNADGNITSQSGTGLAGQTGATTSYTYNTSEQLTGTSLQTQGLSTAGYGYSYGPAGNMTSSSLAGQTVRTSSYNVDGELTSSSNPTNQATTSYGYNPEGERTSTTVTVANEPVTTNYTWNQAGEFTGTTAESFGYNGAGLLTQSIANSTTYNLVGATPQIISSGLNDFVRGPQGLVVEEVTAGQGSKALYYHHDQLGSTRALTDSQGHDVVNYSYSPYGQSTATATGVINPFGFADSYTEPTSGLIYLINRWYDPTTQQFLSVDPVVEDTGQPYSYAGDNPINRIDPLGLSWWNPVSWTATTWENIGTVAALTAAFIPGVDIVAGAVAITAGSIAAGENASQGNWASAGLDVVGVGLSAFGVGEAISADRSLKAAANAEKEYGYLAPWYASDAAQAAVRATQLSRWGAGLGAASFALSNFFDSPSAGAQTPCS